MMANQSNQQAFSSTTTQPNIGPASAYIIQRSSETVREWWTGREWSEDLQRARQYDREPDACVEAQDEMAVAIKLSEVDD